MSTAAAAADMTMSTSITTNMEKHAAADMTMNMSIITSMEKHAAADTTMNMSIITSMEKHAAAGMTMSTGIITMRKKNRCSVLLPLAVKPGYIPSKIWTVQTAAQKLNAVSMPWKACLTRF